MACRAERIGLSLFLLAKSERFAIVRHVRVEMFKIFSSACAIASAQTRNTPGREENAVRAVALTSVRTRRSFRGPENPRSPKDEGGGQGR